MEVRGPGHTTARWYNISLYRRARARCLLHVSLIGKYQDKIRELKKKRIKRTRMTPSRTNPLSLLALIQHRHRANYVVVKEARPQLHRSGRLSCEEAVPISIPIPTDIEIGRVKPRCRDSCSGMRRQRKLWKEKSKAKSQPDGPGCASPGAGCAGHHVSARARRMSKVS